MSSTFANPQLISPIRGWDAQIEKCTETSNTKPKPSTRILSPEAIRIQAEISKKQPRVNDERDAAVQAGLGLSDF